MEKMQVSSALAEAFSVTGGLEAVKWVAQTVEDKEVEVGYTGSSFWELSNERRAEK